MKTTTNLLRALILGCVLCAAPALAQDTGFYVGGAIGQSSYREMCKDFDMLVGVAGAFDCQTREATGGKFFGGWRFNRYFAAELSYIDFGKARVTGMANGAEVEGRTRATGAGLAALGMLPVGDSLWVFGRLGAISVRQAPTLNGATVTVNDTTEVHAGFGGIYEFSRSWAARLEYERVANFKVDLLSLGAQYRF